MIDDLVGDLRVDEGWEPSAYQDHLGYWTIGYGFLIDERKGGEIPREIADQWLVYAATIRWQSFAAKHPWVLEQPEDVQRALGNMAYQLGVAGLSGFQLALAALETGDRAEAAREFLDSRWAVQTPNRAQRVAALIRGSDGSA